MGVVKVVVQKNQTIIDISIQYLGGVESVVKLAKLNNVSASEYLSEGEVLIDTDLITNKQIVLYLQEKQIIPTS